MKRIKLMMAVVAMTVPVMLASCDTDTYYVDNGWYYDNYTNGHKHSDRRSDKGQPQSEDELVAMARTMSGQWRGDMRAYSLDAKGNAVDSIDYEVDIEFKQYNEQSISGTGTQYDFNPKTQQIEMEREFTWNIDPKSGDVYMYYKAQNSDGTTSDYIMSIAYNDLNLDDKTFSGWLWAIDGAEVDDFLFDRYQATRAMKSAATKRIRFVKK